jgi:hypothetical protein
MTGDRQPPKDKPAAPADREAKLAQALRANLRRRKAEAKPTPARPDTDDSA